MYIKKTLSNETLSTLTSNRLHTLINLKIPKSTPLLNKTFEVTHTLCLWNILRLKKMCYEVTLLGDACRRRPHPVRWPRSAAPSRRPQRKSCVQNHHLCLDSLTLFKLLLFRRCVVVTQLLQRVRRARFNVAAPPVPGRVVHRLAAHGKHLIVHHEIIPKFLMALQL